MSVVIKTVFEKIDNPLNMSHILIYNITNNRKFSVSSSDVFYYILGNSEDNLKAGLVAEVREFYIENSLALIKNHFNFNLIFSGTIEQYKALKIDIDLEYPLEQRFADQVIAKDKMAMSNIYKNIGNN